MTTASPPAPEQATADSDAVAHFRQAVRRILETKLEARFALFDVAHVPELALAAARQLRDANPPEDVFFGALIVACGDVMRGMLASGRRQAAPVPESQQRAK